MSVMERIVMMIMRRNETTVKPAACGFRVEGRGFVCSRCESLILITPFQEGYM